MKLLIRSCGWGFWKIRRRASHSSLLSFLILGALAFVVLRWGILALAIALLVSSLIGSAPITSQGSAWYFGSTVFMVGCALVLTAWALNTAIAGRAACGRPTCSANPPL
jgi:hypothetical protein